MTAQPQQVTVLLVEDNAVDVMAVRRAFKKAKIPNPIIAAQDGREALDILRGKNGKQALAQPYLILLDLNMPRMSGLEFLDELRPDPQIAESIVFVLTTSSLEEDRSRSYARHVAGFITKASVGRDLAKLTSMLDRFWNVVVFP